MGAEKGEIDSCLVVYDAYPVSGLLDDLVLLPKPSLLRKPGFPKTFLSSRCSLHCHTMASSIPSLLRAYALSCLVLFLHSASAYVGSATVSSTILIFARDSTSAENGAAAGLRGYGIPFEVVLVPQNGIKGLPILNSSETHGNYGGIVLLSEVGYNYDNSYYSALTRRQFNDLYAYQTNFGVRMVRIDVFPTADYGVVSNGGNLNDEPVSFTNITGFPTANLKTYVDNPCRPYQFTFP